MTNAGVRVEMRPLEFLSVQCRGERKSLPISPDEIDSQFKPGLHYQAEQLIGVLNGQATDLVSLEESVRSMRLCSTIYGLN
ncbi:MAG: hypothetical protein IPK77_12785 [Cellvibrio sp.]|nr:hypothetical protein [Cellvibrio sp.]